MCRNSFRMIARSARIQRPASVAGLRGSSRDELSCRDELSGELSYRGGDRVCGEGERGAALFVVRGGELDVRGGDGRVITRLGRGEVLGEMSLLRGGTRGATVPVAGSARLLALDRSAFERFL